MAKTTNCAFCGKELTTGFFSGTAKTLQLADCKSVACCDACYERYDMDYQEVTRFRSKVENYKKANRIHKLTDKDVLDLYMTYFREREANIACNGSNQLTHYSAFFRHNENGRFCTEEVERGSVDSIKAQIKLIDRQQEGIVSSFGAEDVTQLQYRLTSKLGNNLQWFGNTFLFEVHLNDPKVMTYRPSVTYFTTRGIGILPFMMRKRAEEKAELYMLALRNCIGTNVPVEKVKKF